MDRAGPGGVSAVVCLTHAKAYLRPVDAHRVPGGRFGRTDDMRTYDDCIVAPFAVRASHSATGTRPGTGAVPRDPSAVEPTRPGQAGEPLCDQFGAGGDDAPAPIGARRPEDLEDLVAD